MNLLETMVNNVHNNWIIVWGLVLIPVWSSILKSILGQLSQTKQLPKEEKPASIFYKLIFYAVLY